METNKNATNYKEYQMEMLKKALRTQNQTNTDRLEEWIDGFDMQNLFKVSRSTLYRMRKAGKIPCVHFQGKFLYPKNFYYDWLLANAVLMVR